MWKLDKSPEKLTLSKNVCFRLISIYNLGGSFGNRGTYSFNIPEMNILITLSYSSKILVTSQSYSIICSLEDSAIDKNL